MTDADIAHIIECLHAAFVQTNAVPDLDKIDARLTAVTDVSQGPQMIIQQGKTTIARVLSVYHPGSGANRNAALEYHWANALALSSGWLVTVLKEIQILRGLLSDAQTETGLVEQGRAEERGRVVRFLAKRLHQASCEIDAGNAGGDLWWGLASLQDDIWKGATTDIADLLPLAAANAEVLRLRHALRRIAVEAGEVSQMTPAQITPRTGLSRCVLIARIADEALDLLDEQWDGEVKDG